MFALAKLQSGKVGIEVKIGRQAPYVPDVDGLAPLGAARCVVGEGVWRDGRAGAVIITTTATVATAATKSTAKATTAADEASAAAEAPAETATAAHAVTTAATEAATHRRTGIAVLANLKQPTLPVVAIELLNGVTGVVGTLEDYYSGSLRTPVGTKKDICTDDSSVTGCYVYDSQLVFYHKTTKASAEMGLSRSSCRTCLTE